MARRKRIQEGRKRIKKIRKSRSIGKHFEKLTSSLGKGLKFLLATSTILSALILYYTFGRDAGDFLHNFFFERYIQIQKVEKLTSGMNIKYYTSILGEPAFITKNCKSEVHRFINENCETGENGKEYVFINKYYYIDAIVNSEGTVMVYTITTRDKDFNPTFTNVSKNFKSGSEENISQNLFTVTLGKSKFTDIPGPHVYVESCLGAHSFSYFETNYYGFPGFYKEYAFGINMVGPLETGDNDLFYRILGANSKYCTAPTGFVLGKIQQNLDNFKKLRESSVINTYSVTIPFDNIGNYYHEFLGVYYVQVQSLE